MTEPASNADQDTRINAAAAANNLPDVFMVNRDPTLYKLVQNGLVAPVDSLLPMMPTRVKSKISSIVERIRDQDIESPEERELFLARLPEDADPCAERGEFHTCVTAGPMFKQPIAVVLGETVERDGFVFADLKPARDADARERR